jgi:hypothetical protein
MAVHTYEIRYDPAFCSYWIFRDGILESGPCYSLWGAKRVLKKRIKEYKTGTVNEYTVYTQYEEF